MENNFRKWLRQEIFYAFMDARAGKQSTADEYMFEMNLEANIEQLVDDIYYRRYKPSRGIAFIVKKPVIREIFAAPFRDRIVHHFLYNMSADWWDRRLDYDAYSCRVNKGTLFGVQRLERNILSVSKNYTEEAYVIKLDIKGYFMSLPRAKLVERVEWGLKRQFADNLALYSLLDYLWKEVILDDPTDGVKIRGSITEWDALPKDKSLFCQPEGQGIVIGNLSSQHLSNLYLGEMDMYIRQNLGYHHYGRYVDDMVIVVPASELPQAKRDISRIEDKLSEMGLVLHPNKRYIQEVKKGVEFLGSVVYPFHTVPGRRVMKNFQSSADEVMMGAREVESVISYLGRMKHLNAKKAMSKVFERHGWNYNF